MPYPIRKLNLKFWGPFEQDPEEQPDILRDVERELWRVAIEASRGNVTLCAQAMRVSREHAYRRIQHFNLIDLLDLVRETPR